MFWMRARITLKPLLCFSFSSICRNVLFPRRILCNPFPASKSLWCLILSLSISPWKLLLPCHTFPIRFVLRICCWVNSHHLAAWFCIDNVQRNYFLVIQKRIRVKKKKKKKLLKRWMFSRKRDPFCNGHSLKAKCKQY